jgi:hypothetical protein
VELNTHRYSDATAPVSHHAAFDDQFCGVALDIDSCHPRENLCRQKVLHSKDMYIVSKPNIDIWLKPASSACVHA